MHPWELYNLATEISESKNIASQHPLIIAKMDILQQEHQLAHINEWEFIDPRFQKLNLSEKW